jgi:hypothetical protein
MRSYSLSIHRWHKVAERLSRTYTELTNGVRNTYNNTQVSGYLGESQIARIRELGEREAQNLNRAFSLQDALIQIRQAIGEINAKTGVSHELAEYDALMRRYKLLESILAAQTTTMVGYDEILMLPTQVPVEDRYDRSPAHVKVKVLTAEAEADLRKQAEALMVKAYALSDKISDLNREKLTLDLPEDIAQAAGL